MRQLHALWSAAGSDVEGSGSGGDDVEAQKEVSCRLLYGSLLFASLPRQSCVLEAAIRHACTTCGNSRSQ